jgi:hypothetical protein
MKLGAAVPISWIYPGTWFHYAATCFSCLKLLAVHSFWTHDVFNSTSGDSSHGGLLTGGGPMGLGVQPSAG